MAAPKYNPSASAAVPPSPVLPLLALADQFSTPVMSPARDLQNRLLAGPGTALPRGRKWPGAVRLMLPILLSLGLWVGLWAAIRTWLS